MPPDPFAVSRETNDALQRYQALLLKWNEAINLVGPAKPDEIWERHFADSLQLLSYLGDAKVVYDLGSGAGFPGLVLAIARLDLKVFLVESDSKKAAFLRTVSRETDAGATVLNNRIEELEIPEKPDLVTARALAPLAGLLHYALPFVGKNPGLRLLFPKGEGLVEELAAAQREFSFEFKNHPSKTADNAWIVEISNLRPLA